MSDEKLFDGLKTTRHAAKAIGVKPFDLRRFVKYGCPHYRFKKKLLFRVDDIRAWVESRRVVESPDAIRAKE